MADLFCSVVWFVGSFWERCCHALGGHGGKQSRGDDVLEMHRCGCEFGCLLQVWMVAVQYGVEMSVLLMEMEQKKSLEATRRTH